MFTSPVKFTNVMVAVFALCVGTAEFASADPGKGLRWSDFAWGPTTRSAPQYYQSAPQYYAAPATYSAVPTTGVAVAPSTTTGQTITIRGADGIVRVYPVQGGVVQQLPNSSTVTTQTNPPASGGTSGTPAVVVPQQAPYVVIPQGTTYVVPCYRR